MSEMLSLYEGILIALAGLLTFYGLREAARIKITVIEIRESNKIARERLDRVLNEVEDTMVIYKPALDDWKGKIDQNLEIPFSEHLFHAMFNTLVSLGASDMGKEGQAKQNMAINGFQKIGRAIGKGLKKEIPAIEQFSGMGGGGDGGGIPGVEGIIGQMFGIDIPPGTMQALSNAGNKGNKPENNEKPWG